MKNGNRAGTTALVLWGLCLALGDSRPVLGTVPVNEEITVEDLGLESGFQDFWGNRYRRGRSLVAEDFDGDGWVDFFVGNPGGESFVFRNTGPGPGGEVFFAVDQVLLQGELAFTASGADYDNDSDLDLFVGCGGMEGDCHDFLFRNDSVPGRIQFTEVGTQAGIRGPAPGGVPLPHGTAGAAWGDYDRDGDPDLFVSVRSIDHTQIPYKSVLWRNNGNGTFSDATVAANLDYWAQEAVPGSLIPDFGYFQHSTWIDVDNDGDLDLFLNNAAGPNVLWKNLLGELGTARFVDATQEFSLPGEDLHYPVFSFASATADFNNDGWQDLILFAAGEEVVSSPYGNGNGLFLNQQGQGFFNAASTAGIDMPDGGAESAMGCQAADLTADGIPDLVFGTGFMGYGEVNRLLGSVGAAGGIPLFEDDSVLIDFEALHGIDPALPPYPEIPPYPYRTHGMVAADIDGDGHLELGVVNGGPADWPDIVAEPNRLFRFAGPGLGSTFRVRLRGNGVTDGRDGVGSRAYVEIPTPSGNRRVFQTILSNSGFSAQNERTLTFGLGGDDLVSRLAILWPSGCLQILEDPPNGGFPPPLVTEAACWTCPTRSGSPAAWLHPAAFGCAPPPFCGPGDDSQDCRPCGSDADCQDGVFCNGTEQCDTGSGVCLAGPVPTCEDEDPCTTETCDPGADACTYIPLPVPGEVANVRQDTLEPGSVYSTIDWDAAPLAATYNVYQARQADLADLACMVSGVPGTSTLFNGVSEPGEVSFQLITAMNCSGESTLGSDSAGRVRWNLAPCP